MTIIAAVPKPPVLNIRLYATSKVERNLRDAPDALATDLGKANEGEIKPGDMFRTWLDSAKIDSQGRRWLWVEILSGAYKDKVGWAVMAEGDYTVISARTTAEIPALTPAKPVEPPPVILVPVVVPMAQTPPVMQEYIYSGTFHIEALDPAAAEIMAKYWEAYLTNAVNTIPLLAKVLQNSDRIGLVKVELTKAEVKQGV